MFRWCAYCQSFIGESAPYEQFEATHTVCKNCKPKAKEHRFDNDEISFAKSINKWLAGLDRDIQAGKPIDYQDIIDSGSKLGIGKFDLCAGILQPLLRRIGDLFESGKLSVYKEHLFTQTADAVILSLKTSLLDSLLPNISEQDQVDVLLVCAEDNIHSIGAKMLELYLLERGFRTLSVTAGMPAADVAELVKHIQPKVLSISVMLPGQVKKLSALLQLIDVIEENRPAIAVGGQASAQLGKLSPKFDYVHVGKAFDEFAGFVRQCVEQGNNLKKHG